MANWKKITTDTDLTAISSSLTTTDQAISASLAILSGSAITQDGDVDVSQDLTAQSGADVSGINQISLRSSGLFADPSDWGDLSRGFGNPGIGNGNAQVQVALNNDQWADLQTYLGTNTTYTAIANGNPITFTQASSGGTLKLITGGIVRRNVTGGNKVVFCAMGSYNATLSTGNYGGGSGTWDDIGDITMSFSDMSITLDASTTVTGSLTITGGILMTSPDGTDYQVTVANGGTLTVTAV